MPASDELLGDDEECSGLPWGSISMRHVMSRGHDKESRKSGGDDTIMHSDDNNVYGSYLAAGSYNTAAQAMTSPSYQSYGSHDNSSGTGGDYFDDNTFYYSTDYGTTQ